MSSNDNQNFVILDEDEMGIEESFILSIRTERARQRTLWSETGDRGHSRTFWLALLSERLGKAASEEIHGTDHSDYRYRRRLVELAALTLAALEHAEEGEDYFDLELSP